MSVFLFAFVCFMIVLAAIGFWVRQSAQNFTATEARSGVVVVQ